MKREIKFKAWNSYLNKMYSWYDMCKMGREGHLLLRDLLNGLVKHIEPIQFTGLKDKNGKEIYEGDIVKYYQPYAKRYETHIVKWDENFAAFGLFEKNNEWCQESDWVKLHVIEVLGNIYQNSDLIK